MRHAWFRKKPAAAMPSKAVDQANDGDDDEEEEENQEGDQAEGG